MFKVLGVESRVKIIELLKSEGPLGTKRIAEVLGITPAAASQHLKILRHAGFVKSERRGYWVPHSIDEVSLENCCDMLTEVCRCGCMGPGHSTGKAQDDMQDLHSLKQHKKCLEDELKKVRKRIAEIEKQKD
jgi:DNA-binding transcriptional ArsR family regulator